MQLKSIKVANNNSMLSLTKSIDMASTTSTLSIKTNIERTSDGRFVVKKASSLDDEFSSEAISSDDNDEKLSKQLASEKSVESFDESESDRDSIMDNFDVTLVNDECNGLENEAQRMFSEVLEVLRYEQEVKTDKIFEKNPKIQIIFNLFRSHLIQDENNFRQSPFKSQSIRNKKFLHWKKIWVRLQAGRSINSWTFPI